MNGQRGKMTFMSLIALVILVLGGFMAFKYHRHQPGKEADQEGGLRRHRRGPRPRFHRRQELQGIIEGVLQKKGVEILELIAELDKGKAMIHYSFKYKIDTDYLLFKRSEIVEVDGRNRQLWLMNRAAAPFS